ncbi:GTP pyrophosphokinase [Vibrio sp. 10N.261.46.A3]|uniref:GTP pyrophosphokinase n=1 Tax=Vibrio sp. 10N.261.46.A3 TaxID=3229658 RepID=UPI00354FA7CE
MTNNITCVKQLIREINRIHKEFSTKYFDIGSFEKIKLSRTINNVPERHIYNYRLTLHESINDYLMTADINMKYFYRVKTSESIGDKIKRYSQREDQYPVNNWLNDIFGARIILTSEEVGMVMEALDDWQDELSLKNWYWRDKDGYKGLHVYFKNRSNFFFPWELQVWDEAHLQDNVSNHERFKRDFLK